MLEKMHSAMRQDKWNNSKNKTKTKWKIIRERLYNTGLRSAATEE